MNIIISGYGRMGKAVETTALERRHTVVARYDEPGDWEALETVLDGKPVVIDFSQPEAVVHNIEQCFRYHVPIVVGTTGWNKDMPGVIEACQREGQSLLAASNFSIGMNLFFAVNEYLATLMNGHSDYDPAIRETHHIHKLDKPSGTAITLAEQLLARVNRKKEWVLGEGVKPGELGIEALRKGEVFGEHEVSWESPADRISIRHEAKSRKGFALGAVLAAEWLVGRTGYFGMKDFLGI